MSEERISALEENVTEIRITQATLAANLEHLTSAVNKLTGVVDVLGDNMAKGKGALWLLGATAATAGGIVSWATTLFFHRS